MTPKSSKKGLLALTSLPHVLPSLETAAPLIAVTAVTAVTAVIAETAETVAPPTAACPFACWPAWAVCPLCLLLAAWMGRDLPGYLAGRDITLTK